MNLFIALGDEGGFTIQETLVVLIVGSLLVSLGLSSFQFTGKLVSSWGKTNDVHARVNGVSQRIALDIQTSRAICEMTDSSLVLERRIDKYVVFRFSKGSVWRNKVPMCDGKRDDLLVHVTRNSVRVRIGESDTNASIRVSTPFSSRQQFRQSLKGWNAAGN